VLLDLFAERLEEYQAVVHRVPTEGVAQAVAAALAAPGRPRVVVPDGLPADWLAEAHVEQVADHELTALELDGVDGVVTSAAVAIAETATVVLDGAPGQGRRAVTLVPDLHVCVVIAGQVVQTVPEAVARLDPARPLTWVSGPSATSDIELVRVEGVHGPRRLHVVLAG
jgi:L-lactate dehydrogenase complex protein LldG